MIVDGIEVHDDFYKINDRNKLIWNHSNGADGNTKSNVYRCVICGCSTCIDESSSSRGNRLICGKYAHRRQFGKKSQNQIVAMWMWQDEKFGVEDFNGEY